MRGQRVKGINFNSFANFKTNVIKITAVLTALFN